MIRSNGSIPAFLLLVVFLFRAFSVLAASNQNGVEMTEVLDKLLDGYDKRVRPNSGGEPVDVSVTMYFLTIESVDDKDMTFTSEMYFRQFWSDPRLSFSNSSGISIVTGGSELSEKLWTPDSFFTNQVNSDQGQPHEFIRINSVGNVVRSSKVKVTASCPMNFQYYPMDTQLCTLDIESYGFTMKDIKYNWKEGPNSVGISSDARLPAWRVMGHSVRKIDISLTSGNYSRLAVEIQFSRNYGAFVLQTYLPSALLVIISWVSFWVNRTNTHSRIIIGLLTTLSSLFLLKVTNDSAPQISYFKAIDCYLILSFIMVFLALLVSVSMEYTAKKIRLVQKQLGKSPSDYSSSGDTDEEKGQTSVGNSESLYKVQREWIDKGCRIAFPVIFLIYNIYYFSYYPGQGVYTPEGFVGN